MAFRLIWNRTNSQEDAILLGNDSLEDVTAEPRKGFFGWAKGWRVGITSALVLGVIVLIFNFVFAIWAASNHGESPGLATLFVGSCPKSKNIITVFHLIINIFSTLLLGGSNYCMQILSAPLRKDVDRAHAKHKWMCVGIPNFRNIFYISWSRKVLWMLVAISSIPLHLIWNSAIVQTIAVNDYNVIAVSEEFTSGAPVNASGFDLCATLHPCTYKASEFEEKYVEPLRQGTMLSPQDCIAEYGNAFISGHSNVALVMDQSNETNSLLAAGTYHANNLAYLQYQWPCEIIGTNDPYSSFACGVKELEKQNATHWTPFKKPTNMVGSSKSLLNATVKSCLAQKTNRSCKVEVSSTIQFIVAAANAIKVFCFASTLVFLQGHRDPLVTTGDFLQSLLSHPDPHTKNRCLASIKTVKHNSAFWKSPKLSKSWKPRRRFWVTGASLSSWISLLLPAVIGISTIVGFYVRNGFSQYISFGFGTATAQELVWWSEPWDLNHGLVGSALLANTPQIITSYIYTAYNSVISSMCAHAELLRFSQRRNHLRVTSPRGKQRSSYWLQLPYRVAVPLLTTSALLHWVISEGFFLVRADVYQPDGTVDPTQLISTVGYSAYAIIVGVSIMIFMLLVIVVIAFVIKYPNTMPLAAISSASLAAICQPVGEENFEPSLSLKSLSWGRVNGDNLVEESNEALHATFAVTKPVPLIGGRMYL
jgi:hypothetical protein